MGMARLRGFVRLPIRLGDIRAADVFLCRRTGNGDDSESVGWIAARLQVRSLPIPIEICHPRPGRGYSVLSRSGTFGDNGAFSGRDPASVMSNNRNRDRAVRRELEVQHLSIAALPDDSEPNTNGFSELNFLTEFDFQRPPPSRTARFYNVTMTTVCRPERWSPTNQIGARQEAQAWGRGVSYW
jgi:hypothetical protein